MLTPLDIHNKEFKRGFRGYNEEEVDKYVLDLRFTGAYKKEFFNNYLKIKYWHIYIELKTIIDIEIIQKYFNEELVIDLRGKEPFIEVYDGYRE